MLHGGRQLVGGEQEPTVAGDDEHLAIGERRLRADPGRKAAPECSGRSGRDERARSPEVEREVGREADLGHVLDEHAVVGEHVADRGKVIELRPEMVDRGQVRGPTIGQLGGAVGRVNLAGEGLDEGEAGVACVGVDAERRHAVTVELVGVDVDLDDRQVVVGSPVHDRPFHAAADADHDIGVSPQVVSDGQRCEEWVRGRDHPVTHPARRHRRLQQRRQGGDRLAGVLRPAADDDQRPLGASEERRRAFDGPGVDGRPAGDRVDEHRFGGRRPAVGRHLDGDRARTPRHDRIDRGLDLRGGQCRDRR